MAHSEKEGEKKTGIENLNEQLTSAEQYVEKNKKPLFWLVGIVLLVAVLVVAYLFVWRAPRQTKTMEQYADVEMKAQNDTAAAKMYAKIADEGTGDGANLAALDAAEAYYRIGKYSDAVKYLDKFSSSEPVIMANALVLKGDCYVNLKQYDQALSVYQKAMNEDAENPQICPRVMVKMANIYDEQKKYDKALELYEAIMKDYPDFQYGIGIGAYAARERARLGK